jgi:hypothetical protein
MHANDVFLFFKNHFWHQHIKTIQKVQTALNFSKKKKNLNLEETQLQTQYQTFPNDATAPLNLMYTLTIYIVRTHLFNV